LHALAPPELLALGEARVRRTGRVVRLDDGGVSLDPSTPLPNVTGVLVDGCGQWVGYSAARGAPSMSTSSATLYQWVPELSIRLEEAGVVPESGLCAADDVSLPAPPGSRSDSPAGPGREEKPPAASDAAPEPGPAPEPEPEAEPEHTVPAPRDFPELIPDSEPFSGPGKATPAPGVASTGLTGAGRGVLARVGPWVLGALLLVLVGFGLHRSRQGAPEAQHVAFWLEGESGRLEVLSRAGEVNVVIGRFDVDLVIEAATVSRRHARLFGTLAGLQLMDLDSTNGTRVNGQPCAARVAVTVSPGDRLRFGDQEYELQSAQGSGA
jgi:hypothetical protein